MLKPWWWTHIGETESPATCCHINPKRTPSVSCLLSVSKNKRPAGDLRSCPCDFAAVFLFECPFESPQKGLFGKAAPKGWIFVAAGSRGVLMCHLIGTRCLPQYLSFIGRDASQPGSVWQSCRRICGRYGIPHRTTGTRCCVWHVCQLCTAASLASFLYLVPPPYIHKFSFCLAAGHWVSLCRAMCLTEVSQKASRWFFFL